MSFLQLNHPSESSRSRTSCPSQILFSFSTCLVFFSFVSPPIPAHPISRNNPKKTHPSCGPKHFAIIAQNIPSRNGGEKIPSISPTFKVSPQDFSRTTQSLQGSTIPPQSPRNSSRKSSISQAKQRDFPNHCPNVPNR